MTLTCKQVLGARDVMGSVHPDLPAIELVSSFEHPRKQKRLSQWTVGGWPTGHARGSEHHQESSVATLHSDSETVCLLMTSAARLAEHFTKARLCRTLMQNRLE